MVRRHSTSIEWLRRFFTIEERQTEKIASRFIDAVQPTVPALPGLFRLPPRRTVIIVPAPGAGLNFSLVAVGQTIYPFSVSFRLTTSVAAAGRRGRIRIQSTGMPLETIFQSITAVDQPASTAVIYSFQKLLGANAESPGSGVGAVAPISDYAYLQPGEELLSDVVNLQAGDVIDFIRVAALVVNGTTED